MNVKCRTRPSLAWVWALPSQAPVGHTKVCPLGQPNQETPCGHLFLSPCLYRAVPLLPSEGGSQVGKEGPQLPPGSSGESALLRPISCVAHGGTEAGARAPRTEAIQAARIVGGEIRD